MEEVSAAMDGHTSTATLQHDVASLNADQERVFHTVTSKLSDDSAPPLHLFVSGAGGTGKSFLISVL